MIKVLIIEDEVPAADQLSRMICAYDESIVIEGPLVSNAEIIAWFEHHERPHLIFSDIELLDGPVFHAFEKVKPETPIIFTTAYDQYAIEAFKTYGISYLLKPIEQIHLQQAMDKFWGFNKSFQKQNNLQVLEELKKLHFAPPIRYKSILNVNLSQGIYLLKVEEITCIRMEHGTPYAFKANGKKFPLSEQLTKLQEQLDPTRFFRLNRSDIIQVDAIEKIEKYFNDRLAVRIKGQSNAFISSTGKTPEFRKWLKAL